MLDLITIKDIKENIGTWCRTMRKAENLSQQQLADELELSRYTITNLENGENTTLDTFLKVLQYFDETQKFNHFISEKINNRTDNQSMY